MLSKEIIEGYETEISYQKHMIENLGRWLSLFLLISSIGIVWLYFFYQTSIFLQAIGYFLLFLGIFGMSIFGYGIYKGKKNLQTIIFHFEQKIKYANTSIDRMLKN